MEDHLEDISYPGGAFYMQDGNAFFYTLANLPPTFGAICLQVLDQMVAKKNFIFSMDSYHEDSIKSQERVRRGFSQHCVVGGGGGAATRKPTDWKLFLANEENRLQLWTTPSGMGKQISSI